MLRVKSTLAETCKISPDFRANSVIRFERSGALGILQERRKRWFDFIIALFLLVFLSPALLIIAISIKLTSRGPVFFHQERYGRFKQTFYIYKFRSMSVMENGASFRQAQRHDPRVTKLGAFLRRTSLDELPQLVNVLRGEMSLIGPRPHAIAMDDEYAKRIAGYDKRFLLRPGMTGLAQCSGFRGGTDHINQMIGRLSRDIYYVRNRSMRMDLAIIFATITALLKSDAY